METYQNNSFFRIEVTTTGIATLLFDNQNKKVNTLSLALTGFLETAIDELSKNPHIHLLLIQSAKKDMFIAGAEISEIRDCTTYQQAFTVPSKGQEIFAKIECLPFPSLAIIDGVCLGGGLELALACTFRVATDNPKTSIGLPEINLGIIPSLGGSIRLARLIGIQKALRIILSAKPISGQIAKKMHIVDFCFPTHSLNEHVSLLVTKLLKKSAVHELVNARKKKTFYSRILDKNFFIRSLICKKATIETYKKTKGLYPAPIHAIDAVKQAYGQSLKKAYAIERNHFALCAITPLSKNLIDLFFISESLKKEPWIQSLQTNPRKTISHVAVLGAGTMGGGISWLFSTAGFQVRMKDISFSALSIGYQAIQSMIQSQKKRKKIDERNAHLQFHKISGTTEYTGFEKIDIIVEAIVEDIAIKKQVLKELEAVVRPDTIIATNTSSLSVTDIGSDLTYPERFIGLHFFNPVHKMPLVEVVPGPKTSPLVLETAIHLCRQLKKTPILVKDCNGFLVNRILMVYLNEALLSIENGIRYESLDSAFVAFGMPLGPFQLLDTIGLKTANTVSHILNTSYRERSQTSDFIHTLLQLSMNTSNAKLSFYVTDHHKHKPNPSMLSLCKTNKKSISHQHLVQEAVSRSLVRMINEASYCLFEKIIESPRYLDMALVLGIGFPPFRGGILKYADSLGIHQITELLLKYEKLYGKRFIPSPLLLRMHEKNDSFYATIT